MTSQRRLPDFDTYTLRLPQWTKPTSDRVDRLVLTVAILVTLLAVPIAGGVGLAVYDANREAYVQQSLTRQAVTATVVDGTAQPDLRRNTVRVTVEWQWAATQHTGTLRVSPTVRTGDTVEIWVDENGSMVGKPKPVSTATFDAGVVAVAAWLAVAAASAFAVSAVRALQARLRDEAWQRDIDRLLGRD